jgi:hypothetical protein
VWRAPFLARAAGPLYRSFEHCGKLLTSCSLYPVCYVFEENSKCNPGERSAVGGGSPGDEHSGESPRERAGENPQEDSAPDPGRGWSNELSGTVSGSAVKARSIHGGCVCRRWLAGGTGGGLFHGERLAVEALVSRSRSRGGRPAASRPVATSRWFTAAGMMAQARTIREPRSVLMASRKP